MLWCCANASADDWLRLLTTRVAVAAKVPDSIADNILRMALPLLDARNASRIDDGLSKGRFGLFASRPITLTAELCKKRSWRGVTLHRFDGTISSTCTGGCSPASAVRPAASLLMQCG